MRGLILGVALFLSACAAPLQGPRSVDDGLAYAQAQVTAVRLTCVDASRSGRIEIDDERACIEKADEARQYIQMARLSPDPTQANDYLNKALAILQVVEEMLKQMEKK